MQILEKSRKTGRVRLKPEHLDDLWELTHIITPGDEVKAHTERKVDLGGDRSDQVRKQMVLSAQVTDAQLEHDILRIQGKITHGPEDLVSHGDHHSFTIKANDEFTLTKDWDGVEWQRLERAAKRKPLSVLLVTFDREQAWFAELTRRGYDTITSVSGDVAKKAPGGGDEDFWKTLSGLITDLDERHGYNHVVAASPAFWTDYLVKALPQHVAQKTTTATCSAVGEAALAEVVKRPELQRVLEADQTSSEEAVMQELLEALGKDKACYGREECRQKIDIGQVKTLAVSHHLIKQAREDGWYEELDALIEDAKSTDAQVHLLEHVTQQLDAIGGVAGVLRW